VIISYHTLRNVDSGPQIRRLGKASKRGFWGRGAVMEEGVNPGAGGVKGGKNWRILTS